MKRIFHPWDKWEDYRHNFYGGVTGDYPKDDGLATYASLLRDLDKFEAALKVITKEWTYSCEHNLTNAALNRVAYLGQASCALVFKVPHSVCMGGYNLLTDEEKAAADALAQKYLDQWLKEHYVEFEEV
jgi:hypothetical protein